jgi:hypothetical protein
LTERLELQEVGLRDGLARGGPGQMARPTGNDGRRGGHLKEVTPG